MAMTSGIMWYGAINQGDWRGEPNTPALLFPILKDMGLDTVDIFGRSLDQWSLDGIKSALDDSGLTCACYYISCNLVSDDAEVTAAADEAFVTGIENAQALGAPICFTCGTQHGNDGEDAFQRYIDRLGEKLPMFEGTGMTLVIENAGMLMHTAADMKRAAEALDGLRLCPDTGNFTLWRQDEVEAAEMLMPWAVHYHMKDYGEVWDDDGALRGKEAIFGEGITPIDTIMDMLKAADYDGVLAWEPGPQDEDGVEKSVANMLAKMT